MIVDLLLTGLVGMMNAFTSFLPVVSTLPFGIDAILVTGMGYMVFLYTVFPPLQILMNGFLFYYAFKLSLKLIAMIPIVRGVLHK